jgi:hypothetical protein
VNTSTQRGVGLLDILIALTLITGMVAVWMGMARETGEQADITALQHVLSSVEQRVRAAYVNDADYAGLTTTAAAQRGLIPEGMYQQSGVELIGIHPGGNVMRVGAGNYSGVNGADQTNIGYWIQFEGLNRATCVSLLMQTAQNYLAVHVGTGKPTGAVATGLTRRIDSANRVVTATTATTWCSSPSANTLRWETN